MYSYNAYNLIIGVYIYFPDYLQYKSLHYFFKLFFIPSTGDE